MREFQADQMQAFQELYQRYKSPLYTYFLRLSTADTAEELLQEVFIKIVQNKNSFQFKSTFKTWIWSIANHTMIDHWRSKNHQNNLVTTNLSEEISSDLFELSSQEEQFLKKVTKRQLEECINELPLEQRQIVLLHTYSELSHDEISNITSVSVGAIKSTLFRAKDKLTECFRRGGHL